jgi:hypothetical protein
MIKNDNLLIYSKDWQKEEFITISSESYFDIVVTKDFAYIIKVPKSGFQGAITLALGGLPGLFAGPHFEKKNRDKIRAKWFNVDGQFTPEDCSKFVFMKIPYQELKDSIIRKKNKVEIIFNKNRLKLKGQKEEMEKIAEFIK